MFLIYEKGGTVSEMGQACFDLPRFLISLVTPFCTCRMDVQCWIVPLASSTIFGRRRESRRYHRM